MKFLKWTRRAKWNKAIWLALSLLPGLTSPVSIADLPGGDFACQVIVQGGGSGLVLVQADTKALAAAAALGATAFTTDNGSGPATRVVECIQRDRERFADYQFQQFYQGVQM